MSCKNCLNLKISKLTYHELVKKWAELYSPTEITPGYRNRATREALRRNISIEEASFRYVYCSAGVLSRFYVVRGTAAIRPKPNIKVCESYR